MLRRVHVVGHKNAGKTTLIVELVRELVARGMRVGTIKHSGHRHEPDTPGKDSWRHRQAGATPAAFVSAAGVVAVYLPHPGEERLYEALAPLYAGCDLVLVEGGLATTAPKIEVWRQALGGEPLAASRSDVAAVVSDDAVAVPVPVWPRSAVAQWADRLRALAAATPDGRAGGCGDGR